MTPALKPGYNSDRALCLKQPDTWINVRKDLTGFPPGEKVLESEMDRLNQHRDFYLFVLASNSVKVFHLLRECLFSE